MIQNINLLNVKTLSYTIGLGLSSSLGMAQAPQDIERPNIIYVLADDLGYGDLSCYNKQGKINTPNIDKLASEGVRFTDAHTSSAVCTPTRYGILTGRYNWRSTLKRGVLKGTSSSLIPSERETVASMLKKQGYTTAFIGKWHLGWNWVKDEKGEIDFSKALTHSPNDLGFDYAYGHCGSLDMSPYVYVENGKATQIPVKTTVSKAKQAWWREGPTAPDFIHEDVTPNFFRRAMSYVKTQSSEKKPFFLYLPIPSPHTPILPTAEFQGKSGLNPYGDFVMMIDAYMGELLKVIKDAGIEDNTLIVFTSDNGCSPQADYDELALLGHDPSGIYRGHKADIFEGGHRVPFIVKWPKQIKANQSSDDIICTTDFMATCADITGADLKDDMAEDSFSMLPIFINKGKFQRTNTVHHSIDGSFSIREKNWKLALCPGSGGWSYPKPRKDDVSGMPKYQLYNLKKDAGEENNLFLSKQKKAEQMKSDLIDLIQNGRSTPGEAQKNDPVKVWPQLKALLK